jgi:hypothetical protein
MHPSLLFHVITLPHKLFTAAAKAFVKTAQTFGHKSDRPQPCGISDLVGASP